MPSTNFYRYDGPLQAATREALEDMSSVGEDHSAGKTRYPFCLDRQIRMKSAFGTLMRLTSTAPQYVRSLSGTVSTPMLERRLTAWKPGSVR
jgi:hypothetical protein